jgi:hypothetical protein
MFQQCFNVLLRKVISTQFKQANHRICPFAQFHFLFLTKLLVTDFLARALEFIGDTQSSLLEGEAMIDDRKA